MTRGEAEGRGLSGIGPAPDRTATPLVGDLLNFGDETDEDRVLYIDGLPRPDQLWYEIVWKVASHLPVDRLKTFGSVTP